MLGPQQLAELVATAIVAFDDAQPEAQRQGYTANRMRALTELALRTPTLGVAQDARRRDLITPAQYTHVLDKAGIEPQYHPAMRAMLDVLASPTDLVHMAVREVFNPQLRAQLDLDAEFPEAFADRAAQLGISRDLARDYWADHWQLPSYEQLAEMRFRKLLSPQEFRDALKAIDFAPTWRDKLETIARRIPQITDMVRFAVREVYDPQTRAALGIDAEYPDAFTEEAALHGMEEFHAKQYWAAHWRLPSARQGYQMVWRGEMELPELRTLLKALDYPPKWRERLFNIAFIKPGRIDLKRMLAAGIKDREGVLAGYKSIGYAPADAELMTQLAEAAVGTGAVPQKWADRARGRLYTVAHNEYLAESLDEPGARDVLQQIGALAAEQNAIIAVWNAERGISRLELTPSQIKKAYKKGPPAGYTFEIAMAELEERGMTTEDAETFLTT